MTPKKGGDAAYFKDRLGIGQQEVDFGRSVHFNQNRVFQLKEDKMKSRFFRTWMIWMIGFLFVTFLIPSSMVVKAEEPVKYKFMKIADFVKMANPKPSERFSTPVLGEKEDAKQLAVISVILPPSPPGEEVKYHYHKNRNGVIMMIDGEATEYVEGKAIPMKVGDMIYLAPMTKHSIVNNSGKDCRYMEFYAPIVPDVVRLY